MSVGLSEQRPDAVAKVTGRARYTDDFSMPGMRYAVYVRATVAHARVRAVDATAALRLPGVEGVFTARDVPDIEFPTAGHPFSVDPAHFDVADRRLLTEYVRFYGDEVAIVVARDELTARKAASLVKVEYDELPVMTTPEAALAPGSPELHPVHGPGNLLREHTLKLGGDIDEGLARADMVIEARLHTPLIQHCQLENQTAYAYMDDQERIVIVSSTQIPHICRRVVGQALGKPWSHIRVIKPCVGGGFGNKQDVIVEPMAAFLTSCLGGKAVKVALEREECILATRTRHPFDFACRVGVTREGTLTAIDLDAVSNTGAYASHGHSIAAAGGSKVSAMYPHTPYRYHARTVYSNIPVGGAMRGYGSPQVCFAVESAVEDAARAVGMDSVEFRLKNVGRPGDLSPLTGKPMETHGLVECLRQGSETFGWKERRAACAQGRQAVLDRARELVRLGLPVGAEKERLIVRGVGVAGFSYGSGTYPVNPEPAGSRMTLNQDGTFHLACGATEIGQGADAVFAQMAADTLGVDYDIVRTVSTQDTDVSPFDPGAYASRQTFVNGHAVRGCAELMLEKVLAYAAEITGRDAATLMLAGREVVEQNGAKLVTLADMALDAYYNKDRGSQLMADFSLKVQANPPSFGCTYVEVEVDIALCRLTVKRIINLHDAGVIINPQLAAGQVQGGMSMGLGWALQEELLVDPVTGRVWNNNLLDYKFPTMPDTPNLECNFVEAFEPSSAYGNKALGEPPVLSPAPALRNALLDATGLAVNEIPLTPKNLYRHFRAAGLV